MCWFKLFIHENKRIKQEMLVTTYICSGVFFVDKKVSVHICSLLDALYQSSFLIFSEVAVRCTPARTVAKKALHICTFLRRGMSWLGSTGLRFLPLSCRISEPTSWVRDYFWSLVVFPSSREAPPHQGCKTPGNTSVGSSIKRR